MADQPLHGMGPQPTTQEAIHGLLSRLSEMSLRQHNLTVTFEHLRGVVEKVVERFNRFAFLLAVSGGARHLLPYGLMQMLGLKGGHGGSEGSSGGGGGGGGSGGGGKSGFPGYASVLKERENYNLQKEEVDYRAALIAQIRKKLLFANSPASEEDLNLLRNPEVTSTSNLEAMRGGLDKLLEDSRVDSVAKYAEELNKKFDLWKADQERRDQYYKAKRQGREREQAENVLKYEEFKLRSKAAARLGDASFKQFASEVLSRLGGESADKPANEEEAYRQKFAADHKKKKVLHKLKESAAGRETFQKAAVADSLFVDTETIGAGEKEDKPFSMDPIAMQVGMATNGASFQAWADMPQQIKDLLVQLRAGTNVTGEDFKLLANMASSARVMGLDDGAKPKSLEELALALGDAWEKGLADPNNADQLKGILEAIRATLASGGLLGGHNVNDFDRAVLEQLLDNDDLEGLHNRRHLDTQDPFTKEDGRRASLDELAAMLGIENKRAGAHGAGVDAALARQVALALMEMFHKGATKEFSSDVSDLGALGEALDARKEAGETFDTRTGGHEVDPEIVASAVEAMREEPVPVEVQPVPGATPDDPFNGQTSYVDRSGGATPPTDPFNGQSENVDRSKDAPWPPKADSSSSASAGRRTWKEFGKVFKETVFGRGKSPEERARAKEAWNAEYAEKGGLGMVSSRVKGAFPTVANVTGQIMSSGNPLAWQTLSDSFALVAGSLSNLLLPTIMEIIGGLQWFAASIKNMSPEMRGWIAWVVKAVAMTAAVVVAFNTLAPAIMAVVGGLASFAGGIPAAVGLLMGAAYAAWQFGQAWLKAAIEKERLEENKKEEFKESDLVTTLQDPRVKQIMEMKDQKEKAKALQDYSNEEMDKYKKDSKRFRDNKYWAGSWFQKEIDENPRKKAVSLQQLSASVLSGRNPLAGLFGNNLDSPEKRKKLQEAQDKLKQAENQKGIMMSLRSMAASPQYSDIENAYKKVQLDVLSKDPLQLAIEKMHREGVLEMLKLQAAGNKSLESMIKGIEKLFGVDTSPT